MQGQQGSWLGTYSDDPHSFSQTIQVLNRDVMAEVAIAKTYVISGEGHYSEIGISQMVSDAGVENFAPLEYVLFRTNVTSVTFTVSTYNSFILGRWLINFWS